MAQNLEVKSLKFSHFGKNVPKQAKLSPDSFIQLALQVAFHRMHGNLPPCYETASLRRFFDGRTETIRLPSIESANFVRAFNGKHGQTDGKDLYVLLVEAVNAHKEYSRQSIDGMCDLNIYHLPKCDLS